MSTETNKAIVRRYYEQVIAGASAELVEEFLAENVEHHGTPLPPGREAVRGWVTEMAAAFPDRRQVIDDLFAEGDKVVVRSTFSGTHLAEIEGIPATGKHVTQPSISILRLLNGKIVEIWFSADNLSLMQQLGVIPVPETA